MRWCRSLWSFACLLALFAALCSLAQPRAQAQSSGQRPSPTAEQSAQAQPGFNESELSARLVALERSERLDDSVRRPLELAASALERIKQRAAAGDKEGAARAERIASVAVELAEARLRLLGERALERGSAARRRVAEASEVRAREALLREQERARELARTSATP